MPPKSHKRDIRQIKKELNAYEKNLLTAKEHQHQAIMNVITAYSSPEEREIFVEKLECTCFSKEKTEHIKTVFQQLNEDTLKENTNIISEIVEGQEHIDYIEQKNKGFFTKIANSVQ